MEVKVAALFPVQIKDKVFHFRDASQDLSAFYRALRSAKESRESSNGIAGYQTACMCTKDGVQLVIRRSRRNNALFLATWPRTAGKHAAECRFRLAGARYSIASAGPVAQEEGGQIGWSFEKAANESAMSSDRHKTQSVPSTGEKSDSLTDFLHRIWDEAGLTTGSGNSPADWFGVVNRIIPATRNLCFAQGLPLENCLRIWAPAHQDSAARFNEAVDISADFLAIGEVYAFSKFRGWLPFCHFTQDCQVHIEHGRLLLFSRHLSLSLQSAFSSRSRKVIGLAHVQNNGQRLEAVELALMITDDRYVPISGRSGRKL